MNKIKQFQSNLSGIDKHAVIGASIMTVVMVIALVIVNGMAADKDELYEIEDQSEECND